MSDERRRNLERLAAAGDPQAQEALDARELRVCSGPGHKGPTKLIKVEPEPSKKDPGPGLLFKWEPIYTPTPVDYRICTWCGAMWRSPRIFANWRGLPLIRPSTINMNNIT